MNRLEPVSRVETMTVWTDCHAVLRACGTTRIAFLHLDMDVKEPTVYALETFYACLVPNSLIVLDDYNSVAGETDAGDDFLKSRKLRIQKTHHYYIPAYIQKPI